MLCVIYFRGTVTVVLHHPEVLDQVLVLGQDRGALRLVLRQPRLGLGESVEIAQRMEGRVGNKPTLVDPDASRISHTE